MVKKNEVDLNTTCQYRQINEGVFETVSTVIQPRDLLLLRSLVIAVRFFRGRAGRTTVVFRHREYQTPFTKTHPSRID